MNHDLVTGRIVRYEQFRAMNIRSFPAAGHLSSEVLKQVMPKLEALEASLPPGYQIQIGGEYYKTKAGFKNLAMVMAISTVAVFLALVFQFKNAIKPLLVLAAAPYGMIGAFLALWIMGEAFSFMAFLGVASLVGVIVSHSIVLFDYIEERHAVGDDFENALIDAGILRLRPVLITVFATVLALFPLALHGGPLWKPLCYAQIGGLLIATIVTKLQVPVMYAIFVLDLKILEWKKSRAPASPPRQHFPQAKPICQRATGMKLRLSYTFLFACACSTAVYCQQQPVPPAPPASSVLQAFDHAIDEVAEKAMRSVVEIDVTGYGVPEKDERTLNCCSVSDLWARESSSIPTATSSQTTTSLPERYAFASRWRPQPSRWCRITPLWRTGSVCTKPSSSAQIALRTWR